MDGLPAAAPESPVPVHAAELLPANGNRLRGLLAPTTMPSVDQWLDRFHAVGIDGVTLGIKVPMLLPELGPDAAAYTTFFRTAAQHARARGMTVDVELGVLFCGTVYAECTNPFDGNYDHFVQSTVARARIVLDQVHPDYLTILSEPTTEATLTGVHEYDTPDGSASYVRDVLAGIGNRGDTKVGAGAATWLAPAYNEAILREEVDYLNLHVYPLSTGIADTIARDSALAQQAG